MDFNDLLVISWTWYHRFLTLIWSFRTSICIIKTTLLPAPPPPEGVARYCFDHVCLSVSVCMSVCPANILVLYFSAIRRDIDLILKCIQDTYWVVLYSLQDKSQSHTGTVHCFLKVQSYHKNLDIDLFLFFYRHLFGYSIWWNNKNSSEQRHDVTKNTSICDFNM